MPNTTINWSTLTELLPLNYPLFNDENPVFKAELLPDITSPQKIKTTCLICPLFKPYTTLRD